MKAWIVKWVQAARPKTLIVSFVPILVGTALAWACQKTVRIELSVIAFFSALCIQIGTNLINDAFDFKKGADTAERLGPVRVTQSGLLTSNQVLRAGYLFFVLAAVLAIPLVIAGGWTIVLIGLCSLAAGYAYTGGPFPLAYTGLGDLFVLIFYGWAAVLGVFYLNIGVMDKKTLIVGMTAGTQIGLLAAVLIAINNLRDHQTDRKVNKNTLAVRLGPRMAKLEIAVLCLIPFLGGIYWIGAMLPWAFALPFLVLPFAAQLVYKIQISEPGVIYNRFLAQGALLQLGFGILLSLGLILTK